MQMELLQLRYFCALAESQHLSSTAKKLMISPPSLSITIARLEKELDLPLFDRVKRNIRLNDNGRLFYEHVKQSLEILDQGIGEIDQICHQLENTVKIALTSPMIWNDFFMEFQASYPEIKLETAVVTLEELNREDFSYDFFMGNGWDITSGGWIIRRIGRFEQSLVLVSKKHPLAFRKVISVEELKEETFITLGETNPTTDNFVLKLCESYGFHPKSMLKANYFTRISHLKNNDGVVLISDLGLSKNFIDDGSIHKIKVRDSRLRRYQTISWKENGRHSSASKKFLSTVLAYYPPQDG